MDMAWKVGELARRAGVSVRTLHHYDEIGLLEPEERTRAGHRLYGPAQVRRLQQIASLRQLGLSLDEIGDLLDEGGLSLREAVELQLDRLREEIRRKTRLARLLEELRDRLDAQEEPTLPELTRTIAETLRHERYYTPEQLAQLAERREAVGEARLEEAERAWSDLLEAYAEAMERGLDPERPEVLALARRSRALVEEFTGADPELLSSLREMYAEEGGDVVLAHHGMDTPPGLWAYMARAGEVLEREGGEGADSPSP